MARMAFTPKTNTAEAAGSARAFSKTTTKTR